MASAGVMFQYVTSHTRQLTPVPFDLPPGTAVILDNLSVHRSLSAAEILRARMRRFLPLPAYSLDLNPIKMAFSKLKAHQCRIGAKTFDAAIVALGDICLMFTPDEFLNYFAHAGYVAA